MNQTFNGDVETEISCKTTKLQANNTLKYNKVIIKIPRMRCHPLCPLSLGDKPRQSWPQNFSEARPLDTSHLLFIILVPECLRADLW